MHLFSVASRMAGWACAGLALWALPASAADGVRLNEAQRKAAAIRVAVVGGMGAAGADAGPSGAPGAVPVTLQGYAVLPPQAVETVSAPLSGFVQSVLVGPTDTVQAGQVVARMHSSELLQWQRELIQLEVQARQAQDRLQRSERLFSEGIVAESRVRDDRYAFTQAQVAVKERRQALQLAGMNGARVDAMVQGSAVQPQMSVSAARAGTVLEVLTSAGQRVEAGAPVLRMARSGLLALELQATVEQSQGIAPGARVTVAGCAQPGRVRGLGALMRGGNQAVTVHVDMPVGSACVRPNQAVGVQVWSDGKAGPGRLSVPASALFQHGGQDHVFVQDAEGFRVAAVQVQSRQGSMAQLTPQDQSLKAGAVVAVSGISTLKAAWLGMGEDSAAAAADDKAGKR